MSNQTAPDLSADQRTFFRDEGYLSIPAITDAEELVWLRETYARLVDDERAFKVKYTEPGADGIITQIFSPELREPKLVQTRVRPERPAAGRGAPRRAARRR